MTKRRSNPNWRERDKDKTFMPPKITKIRKRKKLFKRYLEIMAERKKAESEAPV